MIHLGCMFSHTRAIIQYYTENKCFNLAVKNLLRKGCYASYVCAQLALFLSFYCLCNSEYNLSTIENRYTVSSYYAHFDILKL